MELEACGNFIPEMTPLASKCECFNIVKCIYPRFILQWSGSCSSDESIVHSLCVSAAHLGEIFTLIRSPVAMKSYSLIIIR